MTEPVLVSAGAGSGKTWRIVRAVVERVRAGTSIDRIAAVTFTEASASELQDRLRAALFNEGLDREATRVEAAAVCTIHRFALTLLERYPIAAGVRPNANVLDDEQAAQLRAAVLSELVTQGEAEELTGLLDGIFGAGVGLAERSWGDEGTPVDRLHAVVRDLLEKCRSIAMDPARVRDEGTRAASAISSILGSGTDASTLDAAMRAALEHAREALMTHPEPRHKKDQPFYDALHAALRALNTQPYDLALTLAEHDLSRALTPVFGPLVSLASTVAHDHPELRRRITEGVRDVFVLTARVLERYQQEKARVGAIDFEDMQLLAYTLLVGSDKTPGYAPLVARALPFVVVDEFQDTSPLQFRLFEAMRAAGTEVQYVGDLKQAIYGFRAADSSLFASLLHRAHEHGHRVETLDRSRRSRPELVRFANALFGTLLPTHGMPFDALVADNDYTRGACVATAPAIDVVRARDRIEVGVDRLAELVAAATPVLDRETGATRPARWSDCAVLCYTHDALRRWADALRARAIPSVLASRGLYDTLEVRLARALLNAIASPRDTVAAASVLLSELYGLSQRTVVALGLARVVSAPRKALELAAHAPPALSLSAFEQRALKRFLDDLTVCRQWFRQLPLAEAVERSFERVELATRLSLRLDEAAAEQVRANLATIVAVAWRLTQASDGALTLNEATGATLENYLLALERDAHRDPWQPAPSDDGVRLVTLHASKGMEYPIVALDCFAQRMQVKLPRVDVVRPDDPSVMLGPEGLRACGVRFIPDVGVASWRERLRAASGGDTSLRAEWARLLYVAVTRAREHLMVLWPDEGKGTIPLVRSLLGEALAPPDISTPRGEATWLGERVTVLRAAAPLAAVVNAAPAIDTRAWLPLAFDTSPIVPMVDVTNETAPRLARVSPSELCQVADCPEVPRLWRFAKGELHELARSTGIAVRVTTIPDARAARALLGTAIPSALLGKLVHAAVERARLAPGSSNEGDLALAHDVIRASAHDARVDDLAALIVDTLASLRAVAIALGATEDPWSEVPFVLDLDGAALHGMIDLVVPSREGLHIVDLKTHLMEAQDLSRWAGYYRPQLDAYALAMHRLTRTPIAGRHLAIPASGALVTLDDPFIEAHVEVALTSWISLLARGVPGPAQDCARCGWLPLCRVGKASEAALLTADRASAPRSRESG